MTGIREGVLGDRFELDACNMLSIQESFLHARALHLLVVDRENFTQDRLARVMGRYSAAADVVRRHIFNIG